MDTITVNGPEDVLDWDAVAWRTHEDNVARLRRRIFTARLHSGLGYKTPREVHDEFLNRQQTA